MHLEVVVVPHQMPLLPPPLGVSVFDEEVLAPSLDVILWVHGSLRTRRLIERASCPVHMILSKNFPLCCSDPACSSRYLPRNMFASEVDFGQPRPVSPLRFQRSIAGCILASAAICRRNWHRHRRVEWHAPGRRRERETFTAYSRTSNAPAHGGRAMSKLDRSYGRPRSRRHGQCSIDNILAKCRQSTTSTIIY
jgi:hypothetical protein